MFRRKTLPWLLSLFVLLGMLSPALAGHAKPPTANAAPAQNVTAYDLILAMNTLRVSLGNPALLEDPIVNAVAQATAQTMAAQQMSWHIGNVGGRIASAGYGGGAQVFATENFAVGSNMGIDQIMVVWSDAEHMRPAATAAYCHVGAGVAKAANGQTYYVLQAAYIGGKACGSYTPGGGTGDGGGNPPVPQIIVPVKIATPDADGKIYHIVQPGQSFWAIAIAYQITIADLEFWNNISREIKLQVGQILFIPDKNTEGYATPTPVGMVVPALPDEDGKIIHTVASYQTLSTIAAAYKVTVDQLLNLNGLQVDWPLQIGQKLLIDPGIVLSPLEQLTPASDGSYYHTVQSGQTLSGIAGIYGITLDSLLSWNGLTTDSIIRPDQKLLLPVTPPPTRTATPGPTTANIVVVETISPTNSPAPTPTASALSVVPSSTLTLPPPPPTQLTEGWLFGGLFAAGGLFLLVWLFARKKPEPEE